MRDVHAGQIRHRVDEAPLGQEARRRGREDRISHQSDQHGDREHVAHEVERAVVAHIQVDQCRKRDRGLRVHVQPAGEVHQQVAARRPSLDARLDEHVQRALHSDQVTRVPESGGGVSGDESAHEAVCAVSQADQRDLAQQVEPAVRHHPCLQAPPGNARATSEKPSPLLGRDASAQSATARANTAILGRSADPPSCPLCQAEHLAAPHTPPCFPRATRDRPRD